MKKTALYKVELEDNHGHVFDAFNNLEEYHSYMSDLAVEAYDSRAETGNADLFNFITWFIIIDETGNFKSLTPEQFKALD